MKGKHRQRGLTLIELLIVISLVSVFTLSSVGVFRTMYFSAISKSEIEDMFNFISSAKTQAILTSSIVIICPSTNDSDCINSWHGNWIAFIDTNNNSRRDSSELIFARKRTAHSEAQVSFAGFGASSRYIKFFTQGTLSAGNGTLTYCLTNSSKLAQALIINRQGRVRFGEDSNGNSIIENASNKDIVC